MRSERSSAVIIALAFILLLAVIFVVTMQEMSSADDFLKIWAAVGPIVGVVTGLIPTYFFRDMAEGASRRAEMVSMVAGKMAGEGGDPAGELKRIAPNTYGNM